MNESLKSQQRKVVSENGSPIIDGIINGALIAGKVASGAATGVVVFSVGSNAVHAHNETITETLDTPEKLHMEPGDTVYVDALAQGYTHDEIEMDLEDHGLTTRQQWNDPGLKAGDTWEVSPEVVNMRADRIDSGRTITLQEGQTIWGQATRLGVDESKIPELLNLVEEAHGGEEIKESSLPVGFTFTIPAKLLNDSQVQEITPLGSSPKTITVKAGSTIIDELENTGVENPMRVIDEVLQANNMDADDATRLKPGTVISVPAGIIADTDSNDKPVSAVEVVTLEAGSSIINELERAGVADPMEVINEVLDANNLSQKDATRLSVGTTIVVPEGIIPETIPGETLETIDVAVPVAAVDNLEVSPTLDENAQLETAPLTINDVLAELRSGYESGVTDVTKLVEFITDNFEHPQIDVANGITEENVHLLYKLPKPEPGFDFAVNPRTCAKEAITSAPMMALIIVTQDHAHWLTQNVDEFRSFEGLWKLVIADLNSGVHRTHQYGEAADFQSTFIDNANVVFPDGPLFMSGADGFSLPFTETAFKYMQNVTLDGEQVVEHVITSSAELEFNVTGANKKGDFVVDDNDDEIHYDHTHVKLRDSFSIPGFFSEALPLSCDDPITGGHVDFQQSVEEQAPTAEVVAPAEVPIVTPETSTQQGYWVLSDNNQEVIDQSNLSAEQKEFLRVITDAMMAAINSGANINPRVALAQAVAESGWGTGKGAVEGNNIFSVKANREWALQNPDDVVWIYDDEYDNDNNKIKSAFKKYATIEDAFKDYSRMITEAEHYDDAERCRGDDAAYLNGVIHELRENCSIGRLQGEEGVLSYATNERYVEIITNVIKSTPIDKLIVLNPDEQQRQAAQEWLLLHAG